MVTTIQIDEHTMERLKYLKKEMELKTYDAVIDSLIDKNAPKSMAGVLKGIKVKDLFTDLRDKTDRF